MRFLVFSKIPRYLSRSSAFCLCIEMSFSALISDASRAIFSSIRDAADVNTAALRDGDASSRSAFVGVSPPALPPPPPLAIFTSLPQLIQVILSPRRTWTPLHLWHGSLVSVPPLANRDAPVLILLTTLSSEEEVMVEYFCCRQIFSFCFISFLT